MNTFGKFYCITTWGESHGPSVGVVIDGCPSGLSLSIEYIQEELDLRRPGQSRLTSPRKEFDRVEILSGIFRGITTGTPISLMIANKDFRSGDYEQLKHIYRPGHADFTYQARYGVRDYRGGGRASGRETVARVAAGAVAKKLLEQAGIGVIGFARSIGNQSVDPGNPFAAGFENLGSLKKARKKIYSSEVRTTNTAVAEKMTETINMAAVKGDSVGGIVELQAHGLPAGLGDPLFGKLDGLTALALMSVGAVKGVEFGDGFHLAELKGSEANDPFMVNKAGEIQPAANRAGGVLGGISTGMPLVVRAAVKPTPSISLEQQSVDVQARPVALTITGRHDPCIVVRIIPVLEHMLNLVLADLLLSRRAGQGGTIKCLQEAGDQV